jgi:very-short-patch-repair endonuclease
MSDTEATGVQLMQRLPYDPDLRPVARRLRRRMTKSERALWARLRSKQVHGLTFRRQVIIRRYIVDFFCRPIRLAIEVDGISHDDPFVFRRDHIREQALTHLGITVIRFSSRDVLTDIDNVVRAVEGSVLGLLSDRDEKGSSG